MTALAMRNLDPFTRSMGGTMIEEAVVLNNTPAANQLAQAIQQNAGVIDVSSGKIIQDSPKPTSLNVTVTSATGVSAETATINIFNNNYFTALDTDNGSGGGSITYTWGDGFTGKGYERLFASNNNGNGIGIRGFTLQVTVNSTGASTAAYFNTMNMAIEMVNMMGRKMPFSADLVEAIRNSQYIAGTLTVRFPFVLNPYMQIVYEQPADTKFAWSFITQYSSNL